MVMIFTESSRLASMDGQAIEDNTDDLNNRWWCYRRWPQMLSQVASNDIAGGLKWWSSLPSGLWWLHCSYWQDSPLHRYCHCYSITISYLYACGWQFCDKSCWYCLWIHHHKSCTYMYLLDNILMLRPCNLIKIWIWVCMVWNSVFVCENFVTWSLAGVNRTERARRAYIINCRPKVAFKKDKQGHLGMWVRSEI